MSIQLTPTTARRLERCRAALSARDADLIAKWPESIAGAEGGYTLADALMIAVSHLEKELRAKGLLDGLPNVELSGCSPVTGTRSPRRSTVDGRCSRPTTGTDVGPKGAQSGFPA